MEDKDFYEVLQVQPSAEAEVIAGAYNRLARKYHPDVNKSSDATRRMQLINEAYEVLGDSTKRAEYDQQRAYHFKQPNSASPAHAQQAKQTEAVTNMDYTIVTILQAAAEVAVPAFVSWLQRQHEEAQQTQKTSLFYIVYPNPSVTDVSSTLACVKGTIHHAKTYGSAYVDYGRSTAYELHDGPHKLSSDETFSTLSVNLTGLMFNTTYHWRLRYVTKDDQIYTGNDQLFMTQGTTDQASTGAAKTTKVCPKCGTVISRSALYCRECRTQR